MRQRTSVAILAVLLIVLGVSLFIQGCGGGRGVSRAQSTVSGTVADINRNVIVNAEVWVDDDVNNVTRSVVSGAYRLNGVRSGWRTAWARAVDRNGQEWIGSTAVEVLRNEPTVNINIVLARRRDTTMIGGVVRDDRNRRVSGARVLLTTRLLGQDSTSAYDGPYGSIVAVSDGNGRYDMRNVPVGYDATIAASRVGFTNDEVPIHTTLGGMAQDFILVPSDLSSGPAPPILRAIESYTMPDSITTSMSQVKAYKAIRAFTSSRYRQALAKQLKGVSTQSNPPGSLIEIDLYWDALDLNDSKDIAGYGIYRTISPSIDFKAIDFVRDPYANFYGDMGAEITSGQSYYYAVTSVDVQFLDENNNPDPAAESRKSNSLFVVPMGQLKAGSPAEGASVSGAPTFTWDRLAGAAAYSVFVYDQFPTVMIPVGGSGVEGGVRPIWPERFGDSTVGGSETSVRYAGPPLETGRDYYWVALAQDSSGTAYSYGQLRRFTVR